MTLKSLIAAPLAALCTALAVGGMVVPTGSPASAQDMRFLRIGTGSISGLYFPVGGLLANIISSPPGSRACDAGGSCGVPGLVGVAQATLGSVANVEAMQSGALESALVQADVAHFAYMGKGPFLGRKPMTRLRAISHLYPEAVHVVVRADSKIQSIADLKGKRVSLDLAGSGTRQVARLVLDGYGLAPDDLRQVNSQIGPAADRVRNGRIDAFFFVGGFPVSTVSRLAREVDIRLLPIAGATADAIRDHDPFLSAVRVPAGTYRNVPDADTVAVSAQWLVAERVDADTVYGIVRALWHPNTRRLLEQSIPAAGQIRKENALNGVTVPLHPGAARYYREEGMLDEPAPPTRKTGTAPVTGRR